MLCTASASMHNANAQCLPALNILLSICANIVLNAWNLRCIVISICNPARKSLKSECYMYAICSSLLLFPICVTISTNWLKKMNILIPYWYMVGYWHCIQILGTSILFSSFIQAKAPKRSWSPVSMLDTVHDSREEARKLFECMLYPVEVDKFFR